ncbi:hypothetical protein CYMTET_40146 [Cymbomonas tetramitiformis]|uniref:Uncharacterized protein n=1 Tax=Cymbomonas tetramitiformis TaxID=36881 RepID=A0AAE0CA18_9CHLO|nr:hypothetical protein CYMTET_40148 [Cymbomonas tetramitiformis]KAK3250474.1 hypothetical protein CYMTET_40146 [Cymbomonas tetramitiformis]
MFMESEGEEEFPPSIYDESFVGASGGASADRSQRVVGCGAPPLGHVLRPNLILLACLLGLLSFGFAGAAGLSESSSGGMPPGGERPATIPPAWVVVPFVGPWRFAPGGPPSGVPLAPDYDPEEEEQPALG